MKLLFARFLRKFDVVGYSPMSLLNIVLAAITVIGGSLFVVYAGVAQASAGEERGIVIISLLAAIISLVLLIIRNLKIKSVPKIILYTILQLVIAAAASVFIFIGLVIKFTGTAMRIQNGGGTSSGSSSDSSISLFPSGGKQYTDYEDAYARANGYDNAQQANASGFNTSPANRSGFDYNQTESYHKENGNL